MRSWSAVKRLSRLRGPRGLASVGTGSGVAAGYYVPRGGRGRPAEPFRRRGTPATGTTRGLPGTAPSGQTSEMSRDIRESTVPAGTSGRCPVPTAGSSQPFDPQTKKATRRWLWNLEPLIFMLSLGRCRAARISIPRAPGRTRASRHQRRASGRSGSVPPELTKDYIPNSRRLSSPSFHLPGRCLQPNAALLRKIPAGPACASPFHRGWSPYTRPRRPYQGKKSSMVRRASS